MGVALIFNPFCTLPPTWLKHAKNLCNFTFLLEGSTNILENELQSKVTLHIYNQGVDTELILYEIQFSSNSTTKKTTYY